jgi:ribosomal protein S18 acetylase RimI-like enzyme
MDAVGIRAFGQSDTRAVLDLIADDHLPGQPVCSEEALNHALKGECTIDRHWWDQFRDIRTVVREDGGQIVGAASYAVHAEEGDAYILWLHAAERREVVDDLLSWMIAELRDAPSLRAFWIATPLTLGVEGLPVGHRAVTDTALRAHGFQGEDLWLYMQGPARLASTRIARVEAREAVWRLVLDGETGPIGEAEVSVGPDGVGVLWWIEVNESHRGLGHGRVLLAEAVAHLKDLGSGHVVLYVDHDDPTARDRRPAVSLYESAGFVTVDHLWSYSLQRSDPPGPVPGEECAPD